MKKMISFQIEVEMLQKLKLIAKEQDMSVSALIRIILKGFLSTHEV